MAASLSLLLTLLLDRQAVSSSFGCRVVEFQITSSSQPDCNPDVDGDMVVWSTGEESPVAAVQGYDLTNNQHFDISAKEYRESLPKVSGEWVVWLADQNPSIYVPENFVLAKNLRSGEERTLCSPSDDLYSLDIEGEYVVWADGDIWLYHIPTESITQVTSSGYNDEPSVGWPWVVWRHQDVGAHIQAYNISTTEVLTVTFGLDENAPDVWNGIVVWGESTPLPIGGRNIFGLDLNTSERFTITHNSELNNRPRLSDNMVVWSTYGSANGDNVYAYKLATGETISITTPATVDQAPSVSGSVVVWQRYNNEPDDWNVYGARVYSHSIFLPIVLRGQG